MHTKHTQGETEKGEGEIGRQREEGGERTAVHTHAATQIHIPTGLGKQMSYVSAECDKSQRREVPDSQLSSQVLQRPRGWGQKVISTKELTGGICQADSSASEMV